MLRFLLAMMTSSALYATSVTFTSCTAGTTTLSPCPGNITLTTGLYGPNYFVSAFAATGPATGQSGFSALAETTASYTGPPPPPLPPLSAAATASDDVVAFTTGPSRLGLIDLTMLRGPITSNGGSADVSITDGVHTYFPVCAAVFCTYRATLPFDLGTRFQFMVSAGAGSSVTYSPSGPSGSGSGGLADLTFTLLEPDGKTTVPYYVVPEPSTFSLLFLVLAGGAFLLWPLPETLRANPRKTSAVRPAATSPFRNTPIQTTFYDKPAMKRRLVRLGKNV